MQTLTTTINAKADQCVKCGLCLPHCPTYRLFGNENESPRGRIALIQALANQQLPADPKLRQHLAHCLACRSCERVCPSGVRYGYLLDHSRQILQQQQALKGLKQRLARASLKVTTHKTWQRALQTGLYYYQISGLQGLLRISRLLKWLRLSRHDGLLPKMHPYRSFRTWYPARATRKGRLGLFIGCTGHLFDQQTLQDSIELLQRLGYEIIVPPQQTCCGALHQHQGDIDSARSLARQNIHAFADVDTIIYIASGCGAQLKAYSEYTWEDETQSRQTDAFAAQVREITAFLSNEALGQFCYKPLAQGIAIHTPCSLRNSLRQADASMAVLQHIPATRLTAIPTETGCCGAAGSYMLSQAELAGRIRQTSLDAIATLDAAIVTTTNVGCRLHLKAGLPDTYTLIHPVSLLVRQLDT